MQIVRVRAQNQYLMPRVCCVCGASAGADTLRAASTSASRQVVNLPFPLCAECARTRDTGARRSRIGCATGLAVGALSCIASFVINQVFDVTPGTTLNCLVGGLFILSIMALLGGGIALLVLSREPSYKRVRTAVEVKEYSRGWSGKDSITIKFANEQFAELFRQLNAESVLSSEQR